MTEDNSHQGHRLRLKERFLKSKQGDLPDYEILELLLFYSNPRKDMKSLAKKLLSTFGSISAVLNADQYSLEGHEGIGASSTILFKLVKDCIDRAAKEEISTKPIISSSKSLISYLRTSIGHSKIEIFRILYLNKKNMIIEDEMLEKGTIDHVNIYPREILKKALFFNASAIILVHNHPSGKATPSKPDIEITKLIINALSPLNIILHDHIIISANEFFSFKASGLIPPQI